MRRLALGLGAVLIAAGCASAPPDAATASVDQDQVTCREMLISGSNVIEELCLTAEDWEAFERRRRANAQGLVRRMQGMSGAGF
jgi:hypothetical protein